MTENNNYTENNYVENNYIENDDYVKNDDYYWFNFVEMMNEKIWRRLEALCVAFSQHINKVFAHVYEGDFYLVKLSKSNPVHISKKFPTAVFQYSQVFKNGHKKIITISIQNLLLKEGLLNSVKSYDRITFNPSNKLEKRVFNTWIGFNADLIELKEIDFKQLEPILNLIKIIWCNNEEKLFNYVLSWFHEAFKRPYIKNKVAIILHSEQQQIGKGIIINKFLIPLVYGKKYAVSLNGLDEIADNINTIMTDKLLINYGGQQVFGKLKKMITNPTINIEPKGLDKIGNYPDYSNFIITTNHAYYFNIEEYDRRYFALECNPYYLNNWDYFDDLCDNIFNKKNADNFFSYCYYLDSFRVVDNIRDIPETQLKRDIIDCNLYTLKN